MQNIQEMVMADPGHPWLCEIEAHVLRYLADLVTVQRGRACCSPVRQQSS